MSLLSVAASVGVTVGCGVVVVTGGAAVVVLVVDVVVSGTAVVVGMEASSGRWGRGPLKRDRN